MRCAVVPSTAGPLIPGDPLLFEEVITFSAPGPETQPHFLQTAAGTVSRDLNTTIQRHFCCLKSSGGFLHCSSFGYYKSAFSVRSTVRLGSWLVPQGSRLAETTSEGMYLAAMP